MNVIRAVKVLLDAGLDFIIVDDWATVLHGSAHIPNELHLCCADDHLQRVKSSISAPAGRVVIHLSTGVAGVGTYDDALANSLFVRAFDSKVRTLDLPALIRSKRATGSGRDLVIAMELEALLDVADRVRGLTPSHTAR